MKGVQGGIADECHLLNVFAGSEIRGRFNGDGAPVRQAKEQYLGMRPETTEMRLVRPISKKLLSVGIDLVRSTLEIMRGQ